MKAVGSVLIIPGKGDPLGLLAKPLPPMASRVSFYLGAGVAMGRGWIRGTRIVNPGTRALRLAWRGAIEDAAIARLAQATAVPADALEESVAFLLSDGLRNGPLMVAGCTVVLLDADGNESQESP